jgi:hypothetical protein
MEALHPPKDPKQIQRVFSHLQSYMPSNKMVKDLRGWGSNGESYIISQGYTIKIASQDCFPDRQSRSKYGVGTIFQKLKKKII